MIDYPCDIALQYDRFMWEEIHDMPGEIYDLEQFREQTRELMALIDKCAEAEAALNQTVSELHTD